MKKILLVLIILAAVVTIIAGCDTDKTDIPSKKTAGTTVSSAEENTQGTEIPVISGIQLTGEHKYDIIRAEKADSEVISAVSGLWKSLQERNGGKGLSIKDDFVKKGDNPDNDNYEILIGDTNRSLSAECRDKLAHYLDYSITVTGNKIVISAYENEILIEAIKKFSEFVNSEGGELVYTNQADFGGEYSGYKYPALTLGGKNISDYSIIIPANATADDREFAENLKIWVGKNNGAILQIKEDSSAQGNAEILVGKTNRDGSSEFTGGKLSLKSSSVKIKSGDGFIMLASENAGGYTKIMNIIGDEIKKSQSLFATGSETLFEDTSTSLDGKKAIFIGNSMIYYGGTVTKGNYRAKDTGWFYQICKANGENVTVYDCTYGDHNLKDFTPAGCKTGKCDMGVGGDLLKGIDLASIEYVFISEAGTNNGSIVNDVKNIMKRFTNPNVKFFYLNHMYAWYKGHTGITSNLENLVKAGVTVVDWGGVCFNLYKGNEKIAGSKITYSKNSFANNKDSDTHHPNPLAGYVTSLMCYCAATGKSAVGQSYAAKESIKYGAGSVSYADYNKNYYTTASSNFKDIFASPTDMEGIQKLIDKYIAKYQK